MSMTDTDTKPVLFLAGHRGMVGSAIARQLQAKGPALNQPERLTASRSELDLFNQQAVNAFFQQHRIDQVIIAAAKVGGIQANNSLPAEFIYQNLMIEANLIQAAHQADIQQLLFLGSSCIYPRPQSTKSPQPMTENALLTGPLEPTNEPYAIAPNPEKARRHQALLERQLPIRARLPQRDADQPLRPRRQLSPRAQPRHPGAAQTLPRSHADQGPRGGHLGSGTPRREFLHVDDMAAACLHVLALDSETYQANTQPECSHINVGTGVDVTIRELAETIARVTGYRGALRFDPSKPDGPPRKLLDVSRLQALGWRAGYGLEDGLRQTYGWFCGHLGEFRR